MRPCPGCQRPCPCSGSSVCGCRCKWNCERAPHKLVPRGAAPVAGPIFPLAFEIAGQPAFELTRADSGGSELAPPTVCFKTDEPFMVELFRRLLDDLQAGGQLRCEWRVDAVAGSRHSRSEAPEYRCQPNTDFYNPRDELARDIRTIANYLHHGLRREAAQLQAAG